MLAGEEYALQVVVDLRVPDFLAHLHRAALGGAADDVHQDVDAIESFHALVDHRFHRVAVGDIAFVRNDFRSLLDGFLESVRIQIDGKHLRAFFGEAHRRGTAVAPARADRAGARDDRHLAFEAPHDLIYSMAKHPLGKLAQERFGLIELPRLPKEVLEGFRALGDLTGTVSDAMDQLGIAGAVPGSTLRPTDPRARIVAQAITLLNKKTDRAVNEAVAGKKSGLADIEAHNLAEPGDVLVIQGAANVSSMGGVSASVGRRQGEAGAIVDGAVRDIDHSRAIGYPVWSSSVSPMTGKWRIETVSVNKPVSVCGVEVKPGDLVIADEVGVCFLPFAKAGEVLAMARRLAEAEEGRLKRLAAGISLAEHAGIAR